ncbi:hypothetical protein FB45DRAFT_941931 [Roridomyces roridus]|uniref:YCII-related domain-containing protein n=1 Tax=Roridomyces roridus TaxID=1738132 RepID=A0AAD7B5S0_9AGAR|nr:hypothetical protein FB45DRAFT_941931 [Roridomyces roridus]
MTRKFIFFGPYITTPNASELRLRLLPQHLEDLASRPHIVKFGGPFFTDGGAGEDDPERNYGGTFFLMESEDHVAAREIIQSDVYFKGGLWDRPNIILVEYTPLMGYPF